MNHLYATHRLARGFTLIEILVVIGLIAILASIVLVAINPARQFAQARNTQRISNVNAVLNAVGARIADKRGLFTSDSCTVSLPSSPLMMSEEDLDIRPCLVPDYISELPNDPRLGFSCTDSTCADGYHTGYTIVQNASSSRITVCAPMAAEEEALPGSEPYCLTR